MEDDELENKLTAWWLDMAPSRQEELLMVPPPPMPWLDESIGDAGLQAADVQQFLVGKHRDPQITRDAGMNPKPS